MKIIFICYNYLTLFKAINLIRYDYNDCECIIIFRTSVMDLPLNINHHYRVVEISYDRKIKVHRLLFKYANAIQWLSVINRTIKTIRKEIDKTKQMKLVVFKDNEKMESTFIEKFKNYTQQKGKVVLVEEGIGIYETMSNKKLGYIWSILQKAFSLSDYFLNNYQQGYNLLVDEIICTDAKRIAQIKGRDNLKILEKKNNFTYDNCKLFVDKVLGYNFDALMEYNSFQFVFLPQPLSRFGWTDDKEEQIIERLLKITGKNILIKKHPGDMAKKRYSDGYKVFELPDELNLIPFECLYAIMGEPIIITFYSSAYKNILLDNTNTRVILLYKLLSLERVNDVMNNLEKNHDRRIFIPESIEQLDGIKNWLSQL